jgi:AraC-like DNA-binding protein
LIKKILLNENDVMNINNSIAASLKKLTFIIAAVTTFSSAALAAPVFITEWDMIPVQDHNIDLALSTPPAMKVYTGTLFMLPYVPIKAFQHVWLKSEFQITDDPASYQGINLGRLYHTDFVYINGVLIGSLSENEMYNVHAPRNYKIPPDVIKSGSNQILVYLGVYAREHGGICGEVKITDADDYKITKIISDTVFKHIPLGVALFLLGQMIIHLIFFIWSRKEKVHIWAAILYLLWSFFILALFTPYYPFENTIRISFIWSLVPFVSLLLLLIIQSNYKVYIPETNTFVIPVLLISGFTCLFSTNITSPYYSARIVGVAVIFTITPFLIHLITRVNRVKPSKDIYILLSFGLIPGLFIVYDVVNYVWLFKYPPLAHPYMLPAFILGIMMLIIRESISHQVKLEHLYQKLKDQDNPPCKDEKRPITPAAEQKFDRIIAFLKENYTSDISREGLAGAVDMSSDHMSRTFKTYTGMKLNDYINDLRIKDAVDRLSSTDQKIIDIAFAVGFESLTTFNRAFYKTMNETPTDYRKRNRNLPDTGSTEEGDGNEEEYKD